MSRLMWSSRVLVFTFFVHLFVYLVCFLLSSSWCLRLAETLPRFSFTVLFIPIKWICESNEPAHEIMALFVRHKLIFQTHMRSHPVGLDAWCLVGPFVYFHTSCVRTAKALARVRGCADWLGPFACRLCDKSHNRMGWLKFEIRLKSL